MRKTILFISLIATLVVFYFILAEVFPKSASRFPFFAFLLILDIYLWFSLRKKVYSFMPALKIPVIFLYWLPLAVFIGLLILSMVIPFTSWNPAAITYLTGFVLAVYSAKLLTVIFFILADTVKILHFSLKFAKSKKKGTPFKQEMETMNRGKFLRTVGLATGGIFLSGLIIGAVKWAYDFKVRRVPIRFPHLPSAFDALRIVQISDLHLGSWISKEPLKEAVDIINDLEPDLVLFTGDLVNFTTEEAVKFKDILSEIKARQGVYAVLGNHDYGDYVNWNSEEEKQQNMEELYSYFRDLGWILLLNENRILGTGSEQIAIIGVENWSSFSRFRKHGDLKKAMAGTEFVPFKILLSHDPTHFDKEVIQKFHDIDLTLSGHTHGFQFGVEFKNFQWSLAKYMYKYWAGLYTADYPLKKQYLYVNRGLGMIGYPGRVGILPEITLITLES